MYKYKYKYLYIFNIFISKFKSKADATKKTIPAMSFTHDPAPPSLFDLVLTHALADNSYRRLR